MVATRRNESQLPKSSRPVVTHNEDREVSPTNQSYPVREDTSATVEARANKDAPKTSGSFFTDLERQNTALQDQIQLLQQLRSLELLQSRKHNRQTSETTIKPPAKRQEFHMPAKSDYYSTKDFANYHMFISRINQLAAINQYSEEDKTNFAILHLDSLLTTLWHDTESAEYYNHGWQGFCNFLEKQLGNPRNQLAEAWTKTLKMEPRSKEPDYKYL
ncbi:hypothetical protein BDW72DRAFT_197678 [Aspergillus terricola var. indicus]